jgi:outer membrane protein
MLLSVAVLLTCCGHRHPLAEWDPDDFAPADAQTTWSGRWWPQKDLPMSVDRSEDDAPGLPPEILRQLGPLPDTVDLAGAIDLALQINPQTRIAWAGARSRAAQWGAVRSRWYPTITGVLGLMYEQELALFGGQTNIQRVRSTEMGVGLELTWTLLDFGRRKGRDAEFRNALLVSNFMFNRTLQDVVHGVQINFFQLESADSMVEAAQQDLLLADSMLASAEEKYVLGLGTLPEMLSARQAQQLAGYQVELARAERHDARSALLVSMGLMPGVPVAFELDGKTPLPEALSIGVERLVELAMATHPSLSAAIAQVKQAEAGVQQARAQLAPQIDLLAGVGYDWTEYHLDPNFTPPNQGRGWNPTWQVGIIGTWLLFDAGARTNMIRAARAEQAAAIERLHEARLAVAGAVWDAYFQWEAASKQYEWAGSLLESAAVNLEATLEAHRVGLRTMPQVLAAQRKLADARQAQITSRADVLSASADLVYATGDMRLDG